MDNKIDNLNSTEENLELKKIKLKKFLRWMKIILISALVGISTKEIYTIAMLEGTSMEPTFSESEIVFVNKIIYKIKSPEYNDVVAFPYKEDNSTYLMKRIIGKPYDIIDFKGNYIYINNERLNDKFSDEILINSGYIEFPITVPENCYFVLGDNRKVSLDSRYEDIGFINIKDFIGKIEFKIIPFEKIEAISK